jgi:hypothetical protein
LLAGLGIVAIALGVGTWNSRAGLDWLLEFALAAAMKRPATMSQYDGLKVFLCGTVRPRTVLKHVSRFLPANPCTLSMLAPALPESRRLAVCHWIA